MIHYKIKYSGNAVAMTQSKKEAIYKCKELNNRRIPHTIERTGLKEYTEVLTLKDLIK